MLLLWAGGRASWTQTWTQTSEEDLEVLHQGQSRDPGPAGVGSRRLDSQAPWTRLLPGAEAWRGFCWDERQAGLQPPSSTWWQSPAKWQVKPSQHARLVAKGGLGLTDIDLETGAHLTSRI